MLIERLYFHYKKHPWDLFPLIVLGSWILVAISPFFFHSLQAVETQVEARLQFPSKEFWFGSDSLGRSVGLLLVNGAQTSFLVSILTVLFSVSLGIPLGAISGYYAGKVDFLISKIIDILLSFPPLILPLTVMIFLGSSLINIVLTLSLTGWMSYARLMRGQFASYRDRDLVLSAKVLGGSDSRIIFRHILPNTLSPLIIQATAALEGVIIAEAGLSFLGLGGGAHYISWGSLLSEGQNYLLTHPYLVFFPALGLFSIVYALNKIAETLRVLMNPRD